MIRVHVTPGLLRWARERSQRARIGLGSGTEAAR